MKRTTLFILLPLLLGCNARTKNFSSADQNVSINADESGHIAFNLPFVQGQVKVPTSMMHKGNFDIDGVKLMPGSQVTGFNVDAGDNGSTVKMTFTAPGSPDQARAYFIDHFKEKGVDAKLQGDAVTGRSKDGSAFTIHLQPASGGSTGTIQIQSKD